MLRKCSHCNGSGKTARLKGIFGDPPLTKYVRLELFGITLMVAGELVEQKCSRCHGTGRVDAATAHRSGTNGR